MKIYYQSRDKARKVANRHGVNTGKSVKDCKANPSVNGSRWAIALKGSKK